MAEKKFKVNEYITLKLEEKKTKFYLKGKEFIMCKFLLLDIPVENITSRDIVDSIDAVAERFVDPAELRNINYYTRDILPEAEFWGYCSNLQVWAENNYDTRLLHRNVAFPLLKKLSETGDPLAKKVFKEEITKRFSSGHFSVMMFLLEEGYLSNFNKEELNVLSESVDYESITKLNYELTFSFLKILINAGDITAKKVFKDEIVKKISSGDDLVITYLLKYGFLEYLNEEEFQTIFTGYEFVEHNGKKFPLIQGILYLNYSEILDLTEIEGLEKLTSLRTLILDYKEISSLPESIGNLISLQKLSLRFVKLTTLPESIGDLTSLQVLSLDHNKLTTLPESIGNLTSLQKLNLMYNQLTSLPESIGNLSSLQNLNLRMNQLTTVPESIGDLTSLQTLSLDSNKLTMLPESIGNLSSLQKLYLYYNRLTTLPESIINLSSLQILYLGGNKLKTLPAWIGNFTSLKKLGLGENELTSLPKSIGNLTSLQNLNLQMNQLTTLPESIGDLTSLQVLSLDHNQLTTLPESIGNLTSLQELSFDTNRLETLPESITNLTALQKLDLRRNPLNTDPDLLTKSIFEKLKENGVVILKYYSQGQKWRV